MPTRLRAKSLTSSLEPEKLVLVKLVRMPAPTLTDGISSESPMDGAANSPAPSMDAAARPLRIRGMGKSSLLVAVGADRNLSAFDPGAHAMRRRSQVLRAI